MIILRVLFAIAAVVVFAFVGILVATFLIGREGSKDKSKVKAMAYFINTVALAVFFTLWCVQKGIL